MKNFCFLSGLPRSGSTVLAAILNQHPSVHASSTSGLLDVLFGTYKAWSSSSSSQASVGEDAGEKEITNILRNIAEAKYAHIDKPVIIDKSRGWCDTQTIQVTEQIFGVKPKIVATVRNIEDCAASFVRLINPDNKEDFLRNHPFIDHLRESYQALQSGFIHHPECILFVEYENLIDNPEREMSRIHDFLGLNDYEYDFENIDGSGLAERDEDIWDAPDLHKISPKLEKMHSQSANDVLGHMHDRFVQPRFWKGETVPDVPLNDIDIVLAHGLLGDFEFAGNLCAKLVSREPRNHRAAFNLGWYVLREGYLREGQILLDRGRIEDLYGNGKPNVPTDLWDGKQKGTILLNLEGGLGDQIHGARFAKDIAMRGNKVIAACSGPLAGIIEQIDGVTAVVQHDAVFGVVHDYWTPSMSAVIPLNYEYKDINGSAYIPKPKLEKGNKFRIGLRWQGNPEFEHQQHRLFPSELMFNAVKGVDAEFISLQRDEGAEHKPEWVKESCLDTWLDTQEAIASCDLVITSCTSVAHLSAAMGIPTWIVVPILPYYLWAKPGATTEWYNSVKLFRQLSHGDWSHPFVEINKHLNEVVENANTNRILDTSSKWERYRRMGLRAIFSKEGGRTRMA